MGWIETILSAIQKYWPAVVGLFAAFGSLSTWLSILGTKKEKLKLKLQENNLGNLGNDLKKAFQAELNNAVTAIENKAVAVLETQSADIQAFIDTIINSPYNSELRANFEKKKAELVYETKIKIESAKQTANEIKEAAAEKVEEIKKATKKKIKAIKTKGIKPILQGVAYEETID